MDQQIAAPIGFNVTFTGMINLAIGMGLEFLIKRTDVDAIVHIRQMELKRFVKWKFGHQIMYIYIFPFHLYLLGI